MSISALPGGPAVLIAEDAAASARRIEADVRLALENLAPRRRAALIRAAGWRYRAALLLGTTAAWKRFADAIRATLRAAAMATPAANDVSGEACARLRAFLAENPDLVGNGALADSSR